MTSFQPLSVPTHGRMSSPAHPGYVPQRRESQVCEVAQLHLQKFPEEATDGQMEDSQIHPICPAPAPSSSSGGVKSATKEETGASKNEPLTGLIWFNVQSAMCFRTFRAVALTLVCFACPSCVSCCFYWIIKPLTSCKSSFHYVEKHQGDRCLSFWGLLRSVPEQMHF